MAARTRRFAGLIRTVHIYLTLLCILFFLFFAATGFMLNHSDWFGMDEVHTETAKGRLSAAMLNSVDRLAIVEALRAEYGAAGAVESFEVEETELRVVFKRPGRRTEALIDRHEGTLEVTTESQGAAAVLTGLHTGADAGAAGGGSLTEHPFCSSSRR